VVHSLQRTTLISALDSLAMGVAGQPIGHRPPPPIRPVGDHKAHG